MERIRVCSIEEKIFQFLVEIKNEKPEFYEAAKRILSFIYKDVRKDCFNKLKQQSTLKRSSFDNDIEAIDKMVRNLFESYVECQDGVLDNLFKICRDEDKKFFNKMYESVSPFLDMLEAGIYSNYNIYNYVFNLYVILKAYECRCDDYDTFSDIVDDVSNLFISTKFSFDAYSSTAHFTKKKPIIEFFVKFREYSRFFQLRENFKLFLDEINCDYYDSLITLYNNVFKDFDDLYLYIDDFMRKGIVVDSNVIKYFENDFIQMITETKCVDSGMHSVRQALTRNWVDYFSKVLLRGNRFDYISNKLNEIEDSLVIKQEVLKCLKKLDDGMFDKLNELCDSRGDMFIYCMDILFDSDTYYELKSKLSSLVDASKFFELDKTISLDVIADLKSSRHKEIIDGYVMSFAGDKNMNIIKKPVKIFDRMVQIHKINLYAPDEAEYRSIITGYRGSSLESIVCSIQRAFTDNRIRILEREKKILKELEEQAIKQKAEEEPKKAKGLGNIFTRKSGS